MSVPVGGWEDPVSGRIWSLKLASSTRGCRDIRRMGQTWREGFGEKARKNSRQAMDKEWTKRMWKLKAAKVSYGGCHATDQMLRWLSRYYPKNPGPNQQTGFGNRPVLRCRVLESPCHEEPARILRVRAFTDEIQWLAPLFVCSVTAIALVHSAPLS